MAKAEADLQTARANLVKVQGGQFTTDAVAAERDVHANGSGADDRQEHPGQAADAQASHHRRRRAGGGRAHHAGHRRATSTSSGVAPANDIARLKHGGDAGQDGAGHRTR
ncbi:MAG: hypothetical protein U0531_00840 [Dehalococcoidia bacterium]